MQCTTPLGEIVLCTLIWDFRSNKHLSRWWFSGVLVASQKTPMTDRRWVLCLLLVWDRILLLDIILNLRLLLLRLCDTRVYRLCLGTIASKVLRLRALRYVINYYYHVPTLRQSSRIWGKVCQHWWFFGGLSVAATSIMPSDCWEFFFRCVIDGRKSDHFGSKSLSRYGVNEIFRVENSQTDMCISYFRSVGCWCREVIWVSGLAESGYLVSLFESMQKSLF